MLINTIYRGVEKAVDEAELLKTEGVDRDDDNERTTFVEYRFPWSEEVVHRSVHVTLKKWPEGMEAVAQSFVGGQ